MSARLGDRFGPIGEQGQSEVADYLSSCWIEWLTEGSILRIRRDGP
jgi:hypothetical protein